MPCCDRRRARRLNIVLIYSTDAAKRQKPGRARHRAISAQCRTCPRYRLEISGRFMTDRFDVMAIRIEHECAVIVGVIVWPQTRSAIVAAAGRRCG